MGSIRYRDNNLVQLFSMYKMLLLARDRNYTQAYSCVFKSHRASLLTTIKCWVAEGSAWNHNDAS